MRFLAVVLCVALLQCQLQSEPVEGDAAGLRVVVIQGEASINNINSRSATAPIVRVENGAGKPVGGAAVSFILPTQGASGEFAGGETSSTVSTDKEGRAAVRSLRPNSVAGKVEIRVNAAYRGETARAVITQFNLAVPGKRGGAGKKIAIVALLGAAAAGGAFAAAQAGGRSPSTAAASARPVPIVIAPGAGTAGPPF